MHINYLGHSSFKIKTASATIITDPFGKNTGLKFPPSEGDIVTISHHHESHDFLDNIKSSEVFLIDGPGEYEIKNIMIKGTRGRLNDNDFDPNIIFQFEAEEITFCHLGDLNRELTKKEIEELENVDILMLPIGGVGTINIETAKKIIKTLEPSIVLPMHYKLPGMSSAFDQLATIDDFFQEMSMEPKMTEKLSITAATLPEETEIVVLERKS